jgi:hypothetical protein
MTLHLHKPDGRGGLVPTKPPTDGRDWRRELASPRWRASRLRNPEHNPTSTPMAIAFWVILAGLTFVSLMVGYGLHFWR